jgi:hypothetical protein
MTDCGEKIMQEKNSPELRVRFADPIASTSKASMPQQQFNDHINPSASSCSPCIVRVESLAGRPQQRQEVLYTVDRTPKLVFAFLDDFMAHGPYQLHMLIPYNESK